MNDVVLYIKESYNELIHKVTWPTWPSLTCTMDFGPDGVCVCCSLLDVLQVFELRDLARWQPWCSQRLCFSSRCNDLAAILAVDDLCVEPTIWP